jgi:NADH-quinone oxidoreductase subunit C
MTPTIDIPGLEEVPSADGMPTAYVTREQLPQACERLRDEHRFSVLVDMAPVDLYPREPRFEITYLLLDPGEGGGAARRLRLKVRVPGTDARVPTLSHVWKSANWAERETYDFYGIHFDGHPDLRRILMPDDWQGFPMRKDYPVQIKEPVKTYEPLQVSEEQFVATIENARQGQRPK